MPLVTISPAEANVREDDDWLFDGRRDYLGQIDVYRAYKNGG